MSIKLTKTIEGKDVVLEFISIEGKTCVTEDYYEREIKPKGITKKALEKENIEVWKPPKGK